MAELAHAGNEAAAVTVRTLLVDATIRLRDAGAETPRLDAELLLAAAADCPRSWLLLNRDAPIDAAAAQCFNSLLDRRRRREPVSRILGQRAFWSHELTITPDVLDPRSDSETLIETALDAVADVRNESLLIADLGTGSGCLLLALLAELPHAYGIGVDRQAAAIGIARHNAERVGLAERASFVVADWGSALDHTFDLVVCNPPYLTGIELETCQPEVDHDPIVALDGGCDGLTAYRAVVPQLQPLLASGGYAVFEIGQTQAEAVCRLIADAGLCVEQIVKDLAGHDRCIIARGWENFVAGAKKRLD